MHQRVAFGFNLQVTLWLWFTVLFANFAEAMAEGRGKAQADTLRKAQGRDHRQAMTATACRSRSPASLLRRRHGLSQPGDCIPGDGEVIEGIASVNEAAITGETAPVIREAGGDRSAVTGGTRCSPTGSRSDHLRARPDIPRPHDCAGGGRQPQKTPNEIALNILLSGLTIIFLLAVVTCSRSHLLGAPGRYLSWSSLLVCLIPTTIGGLLSAIGIAGMDRLVQYNVLAMSGRAVEAAGDVNTLLLDKTGTITLGNRLASEFFPRRPTAEAS